jgi:hypothetical protein
VIQNTIFFALNLSHRPVSGRSNECAYSSTKSLLQSPPPVRQSYATPTVNFGSGSQCSSHYLKAHGFPWNSGLVRNPSNPPFHESRFLLFGGISPRKTADVGNRACCLPRRCASHWRNSQWATAEAVCGLAPATMAVTPWKRSRHQCSKSMLVILVTESRDQHHRSPRGLLRT